ncbi:hypothetical protein CAPTEDRAFT_201445, partial [Capitella teleta]
MDVKLLKLLENIELAFLLHLALETRSTECAWRGSPLGRRWIEDLDHRLDRIQEQKDQLLDQLVDGRWWIRTLVNWPSQVVEPGKRSDSGIEPIKQRHRRVPASMYEEVKEHLKMMLDCKVIQPSHSTWQSPTIEEHMENLKEVFVRLRDSGLKLKPSKCKFLKKK